MDYIELITQSTFFSYVLFGNTLGTWLIGLFVGGATFVGMLSIQRTLVNRIGKFAQSTIQDFDDLLISVVQSIKAPTSLMLSVFIASRMVSIPLVIDTVVFVIFALSLVRQLSISLRIVVSYIIRKQLNEDELKELVQQKINELTITDLQKQKGQLIGIMMKEYGPQIDGSILQKVINSL